MSSDSDIIIKSHLTRLLKQTLPNHPLDTIQNIAHDTFTYLRQPYQQQTSLPSSPYVSQNFQQQPQIFSIQELIVKYSPYVSATKLAGLTSVLRELDLIKLNEDQLMNYLNDKLNFRVVTQQSLVQQPLFEISQHYKNELSMSGDSVNTGVAVLEEADIVSSVINCLNGSTSDLFPIELLNSGQNGNTYDSSYFDEGNGNAAKRKKLDRQSKMQQKVSIKIQSHSGLSFGDLGIVYELLELSLIYLSLQQFKSSIMKTKASALHKQPTSRDQLELTILGHLNVEILNYSNQINTLKNLQSLRMIHFKLLDTIIRFRFLKYLIIDKLQNSCETEVEFVNLVYSCAKYHNGDPIINEVASRIFDILLKSYLITVNEYLNNGDIDGSNNNTQTFYIKQGKMSDLTLVPDFIKDENIYELIYKIGKTVKYLKTTCGERIELIQVNSINDFKNLKINYLSLVKKLNYLIFDKFNLIKELKNLNKYLLMRQGNFINSILINGYEMGSKQLISVLNESIRQSLNKSDELIHKLDIRVINQDYLNNDEINWDLIVLDYKLSAPLTKVLIDKKEYLRMFNYLFKFKRLHYLLNSQWTENNWINRMIQKDVKLIKSFKRLNILRNEFLKFIGIFNNFINLNIIEKNFNRLIKRLEKAEDKVILKLDQIQGFKFKTERQQENYFELDELINLHSTYIKNVTRHKLFIQPELINSIDKLISVIERFINLNAEINKYTINLLMIQKNDDDVALYNELKLRIVKMIKDEELVGQFEDELILLINNLIKEDQLQDLKILGVQLS